MSGIESLVTQVKRSDQTDNNTGGAPPPYVSQQQQQQQQQQGRNAGRPLTIDTEADAPPSQSCFTRLFSCCRAEKPRRQAANKQSSSASGTYGNQVYTAAGTPASTNNSGAHGTNVPARSPASPGGAAAAAAADDGRVPGRSYLLPPLTQALKGKKTLVLDLDETLVHSSFKYIPDADFEITIELAGALHRVYIRKRPGVHKFLEHVAKRWEVVIFTASLAKYADPLLDVLDETRVIDARLFRESCVRHHDSYVKDLTMLGRRLQDTTIIDNSPLSYMFQPNYAIPITTWFSDPQDRQLYELLPFLDALAEAPDVADVLYKSKLYFASGGYIPPANGQIPGLPPMGPVSYYDDDDGTGAGNNGYSDELDANAAAMGGGYALPVVPPPPPPMMVPVPNIPVPPLPTYASGAVSVAVANDNDEDGADSGNGNANNNSGGDSPSGGVGGNDASSQPIPV